VDTDEQQPQPGLRPLVGVAVVLGLVACALGIALVLRQPGTHPSASGVAAQTPGEQIVEAARGSSAAPMPTSTVAPPVAVPGATGTPVAETTTSIQTTVGLLAEAPRQARVQTPRPMVIGTLQAPPRPATADAGSPITAVAGGADAVAGGADAAPSASRSDASQSSASGEMYTGLPVALPPTAVLDGAELPVGPAGVRTDAARAFAQTLLRRALAQDAGLAEDPALRQVAEQALVDQLTLSIPTGRVVPTRLRRGSVTVQIDIVATQPMTTGASIRMFSSAGIPEIGIAVGIAGRIEPDYLPDLVAVAAVAYR
jgi:hypothetical protein